MPLQITDHRLEIGGMPIFARGWRPREDQGRPPILMLHDSLGCVALWRDFPEILARACGRRVIAYDRLGFGESGPRHDKLGTRFVAEEAASVFPALAAALGFDQCVLFGHSVGGGMAVACAASFPSLCAALITESAQAFVEDRTLEGIRIARDMFRQPGQLERLSRYHGTKAQWVLDSWIDTWLAPEFRNWSLDAHLPLITCPALVIHGDSDEYGTPRHAEIIAGSIAGPSRLEVLPGVRHVPHREREDRIASLVAAFLHSS